jgi:hypothetical protein
MGSGRARATARPLPGLRVPSACGRSTSVGSCSATAKQQRLVAHQMAKKTVLIVEDNELNMKLFHDLLEAHGYRPSAPATASRRSISPASTVPT